MLTFLDVALFVWLCCCWLLLALPYPWFVAVIETKAGALGFSQVAWRDSGAGPVSFRPRASPDLEGS